MNEIKCPECGNMVEESLENCPTCGYPLKKKKEKKNSSVSLCACLALIIGVIIIGMGAYTTTKSAGVKVHTAKTYEAEYAAFGADFYTEIYGATKAASDSLNNIDAGLAIVSKDANSIINAMYFSTGMIIMAIGGAVVAVSITKLRKN